MAKIINNTSMKKLDKIINVTQPTVPDLDEFMVSLKDIWDRKQLTNNGRYHQEFEKQLADFLGVKYISLFSNGTLALISALQVLRISGEVITTPYSFVATTHSLWWNGIRPVFVDIEPERFNLDPARIEAAITPKTTAILPVHVYGNPCEVEEIQKIADIYGLKVIYDAAHAFGVRLKGNSVLNYGDLSILSFHATKTFNTIEGGAIICHDENTKKRIDYLKNFGFADEVTVVAPGINAKMNELQAAYGLIQMKSFKYEVAKRKHLAAAYRNSLADREGLTCMEDFEGVDHNYSYFPIFIDENKFGMTRDEVYFSLRENNIYGRRYFYPLISEFPTYRGLASADPVKLPVADRAAKQVICLPIYPELTEHTVEIIAKHLKNLS
jgi:dTDP-4-amino-4,6-dideoxygalactose transaminase